METNIKIEIGANGLPMQKFNGKEYYLYSKERYFSKGANRLHKVVYESINGKVPKGYQIHHKDHNTWNNNIDNFECVEVNKHLSMHIKERIKNNPEWFKLFHKNGIESAKEWHKSNEGIEWHKQHAKNFNFGKFNFGKTQCVICKTDFDKKTKLQRFCTNKCKSEFRRQSGIDNEKRNCIKCSNEFIINKYTKTKTCSIKCR